MRRPCHPRFARPIATIALITSVLVSADPALALALAKLGPLDNVLVKNPYASPAGGAFGQGVVSGDFDGDGTEDLAISEADGTRLRILLGVDFAVGTHPLFSFTETTVTLPDHSYEMASGDFDGDGRDEIAVGAMGATYGGSLSAGQVFVLNRVVNGGWSVQSEIHAGGAFPGAPQTQANFGNSLAAGDFNDDGFADLAIGLRGQTVGGVSRAGAVMITYGSSSGITSSQARIINRSSDGLTFSPTDQDYFGWDVAAGDFDGDGDDDLAVGILNGTCQNGIDRAGAVVVLKGSSASGITNAGSHIWRPGTLGIEGNCSTAGYFGSALASAHFGQDGAGADDIDDLVIGAPLSDGGQGAVHVIFGTESGLAAERNERLSPPALPGIIGGNPHFGAALATGNLVQNCDFVCTGDSLAVGAPDATVSGANFAGAVWIYHATYLGAVSVSIAQPILPVLPLKVAGPHANDKFGYHMAVGDFNGDGLRDIAIGTYGYDDGGETDAGAVQVIYQSERLFVDGFE